MRIKLDMILNYFYCMQFLIAKCHSGCNTPLLLCSPYMSITKITEMQKVFNRMKSGIKKIVMYNTKRNEPRTDT